MSKRILVTSDGKVRCTARLRYWAAGTPIPQGSKRVWKAPDGSIRMREDAGVRHETWRYELAAYARIAMQEAGLSTPFREPIYVALHFALHRPLSHYGSGKNIERLVPSAPPFPSQATRHRQAHTCRARQHDQHRVGG